MYEDNRSKLNFQLIVASATDDKSPGNDILALSFFNERSNTEIRRSCASNTRVFVPFHWRRLNRTCLAWTRFEKRGIIDFGANEESCFFMDVNGGDAKHQKREIKRGIKHEPNKTAFEEARFLSTGERN